MGHPRLSAEEIERRGQALYEQKIRARVEVGNEGKICMIDDPTGFRERNDREKQGTVPIVDDTTRVST